MAKLAFYTFAVLEEAFRHQHSRGFVDRITGVFESAEQASGFVGRADSVRHEGQDAQWGDPQAAPRFNARQRDARRYNSPEVSPDDHEAVTLSLWDDLESVYAFAYYGRHAEALKKRQDWFVKPEWPSFVAWWVENGQIPTWEDACSRLELLNDEGPPHAFDFKTPFDSAGQPWRMDRSKIQEKSERVKMFDKNNPTGI
jgi:hypothetical protein